MRLGRYASRLALALAAAAPLTLGSVTLLANTQPAPSSYTNISASTIEAIRKDSNETNSVNLIVDQVARRSSAFKSVSAKLQHQSGSVWSGSLSDGEVVTLAGVGGITLDLNRAVNQMPVNYEKPKGVIPKLNWDGQVTINDTDPALKSTRQALGIDGSGVLVAVLDTGVDSLALGLGGNKVVHREDFSTPPSDSSCTDDGKLDPYGHGTHVSSILAGAVDPLDPEIEGVAPGAQIVDLRVLNCAGSGYMSDVNRALQWILDNRETYPIKVANLSLGARDGQKDGLDTTSILINRLAAAGVFVAVAAGNGYAASENLFSPATAEFATTVAAATVNKFGKFLAQFSSHGPTSDGRPGIDITAPGAGIRAALTTKRAFPGNHEVTMAGTSMAAPYIAGLAALMIQQHPEWIPTGELCDVGADCPTGVVKEQMTNQILSHMKTSDWFEAGIDPHSGAGIVSASASLNQTEMPAAKVFRGSTDVASDNIVRFSPSATGHSISILLDSSWRTDMWDISARFSIGFKNQNYDQLDTLAICTLLADTSCLFGEMSFTPRLFTYYVAPSQSPTYMVIRTNKAVSYTANIDSYTGQIGQYSGVASAQLDLTSASSGSINVKRTVDSQTETNFTVTTSAGLSSAASVTLPAGPAGTSVDLQIEKLADATNSLERVVFTNEDGFSIASAVKVRTDGNGPLIFPNEVGYDDSGDTRLPHMSEDGTLLGESVASGMRNASGYSNPYLVPSGTRLVQRYDITQTSTSQINSLGISQDGTTGFFSQFPAGAGIVPGDDDMYFTYFVRNLQTGLSYRVGPDFTRWPNWWTSPYPSAALDGDGAALAWAITYPDGENPTVLVVDHGAEFATHTTLATFSAETKLQIFGMANRKVLVRVTAPGTDEFRLYSLDGIFETVFNQSASAIYANFSADGNAVGIMDANVDRPYCWVNGTLHEFPAPTQLGMSFPNQVMVANDCSWFVTGWETKRVKDRTRGWEGIQLIRIRLDGTVTRLDSSPDTSIGWISNRSATKFFRVTDKALEPGDLNSDIDIYRGLGQASEVPVKLKLAPTLLWDVPQQSMAFGESINLVASSSSSEPIKYMVDYGPCRLEGTKVIAEAGAGTCSVTAYVEENADYLAKRGTLYFGLLKALRPDSWMTIQVPGQVALGSITNFTVTTKSPGDFTLSVEGPCSLINFQLVANGTGDCKLISYSDETENYRGYLTYQWIHIGKSKWSEDKFKLVAVESAVVNATIDLQLTNTTGQNASLWVEGGCQLSGLRVQLDDSGSDCLVRFTIAETETHQGIFLTRTIKSVPPTLITSRMLTSGWLSSSKLPQGQYLDFNSTAVVTSGSCSAAGTRVTANGSTGTCVIEVGGYQAGSERYTKEIFTIKLGASSQSWIKSLPSFSTKKLSSSKYTFITSGQPVTNYGKTGTWKVSTGCQILKSGSKVTIDMGKAKKCIATVSAPADFKLPGLSKTFIFTR